MEFNDASPTEKLDLILNYLVNSSKPPNKYSSEIKTYFNIVLTKEMYEILYKLEKDGYIVEESMNSELVQGASKYRSTFDGRLFLLDGGYAQQKISNDLKGKYLETAENLRKRNEWLVAYGTSFAGLVAFFLLAWETRHLILRIWHYLF